MRVQVRVTGAVQGVGFRPFVYRHAHRLGLRGWVRNDGSGVLIEAEGDEAAVSELIATVRNDAPALACVRAITSAPVPSNGDANFSIVASRATAAPTTDISADTA